MAEVTRCPACGRTANARFAKCPSCGASMSSIAAAPAAAPRPATRTCAACGRVHGAGFSACPNCGARAGAARDYAAIAERAIVRARPFVNLVWHPAAALTLDLFFDLNWGAEGLAPEDEQWRPTSAQRDILVEFGAYFGELIRRDLGGAWQDDAAQGNDPVVARLVLPGGAQCFPVSRALKRMQSGASASFSQFHAGMRGIAGVRPAPTEIEGWLEQASQFERVGRGDLAVLFYDRAAALGGDAPLRERIASLRARAAAPPPEPSAPEVASAAPAPTASAPAPQEPAAALPQISAAALAELANAGAAMQRGAHADALAAFDRALVLEPAAKEGLIGRAGALLALGRVEEARAWLDDFAMREDCEPTRTLLAAIAADDASDAVTAHERFTRIAGDRRLSDAHRGLAATRSRELAADPRIQARAIERIENLADAVRAYERLCAEHPRFAAGWCEVGVGHTMLGHGDQALAAFDRAIALDPSAAEGHDHKAVTLARLGRLDAALAALDLGLSHCPGSVRMMFRKGVFLASAGRTAEALAVFADVARANPAHADVWANKADVDLREGRTADAIADLRAFLANSAGRIHPRIDAARARLWTLENPGRQRDPDRARTLRAAAAPALLSGDYAAAVSLLDAATSADPLVGEVWLDRGTSLAALGRTAEALASFERAEELLGATAEVAEGEVAALLRLGRADDAVRCHDRHLARGKPAAESLRAKAATLTRIGRPADALPLLRRLIARDPLDVALRAAYAQALAAVPDGG